MADLDMLWLTQGPMALADSELDVESMEQEVAAENTTPPLAPPPAFVGDVDLDPYVTKDPDVSCDVPYHDLPGSAQTTVTHPILSYLRNGNITQEKGSRPISEEMKTPKFSAVKVHCEALSSAEGSRSFVVTNQTTARDLVAIVLASFNVVCEDQNLFGLVLERNNKRFGTSSGRRTIPLQDSSKPLDLQARYSRGDSRFCLQLKPGAGSTTVHGSCIRQKGSPSAGTRPVFVSESTTCRDLLTLLLRVQDVHHPADSYALFEVDANSKDAHELCLDHRPLVIQQQWLDPDEYYFEIRHKGEPPHAKIKRGSKPKVRDATETKKDSAPSGKNDVITQSGDRESTMAKLKDSLSKLREHLDNLQKRKSMSYDTASDEPHGDRTRNDETGTDSSDEGHLPRDLKAEVLARHPVGTQNGGYDTGDTSLNESDAGSTTASMRGNNDSAYASDRMSHKSTSYRPHVTSQHTVTSSVQSRRGRRGSYTSSDQSSPEHTDMPRGPQLRKTQSLYELERSAADRDAQGQGQRHGGVKPTRIRSASHAQSKVRLQRQNGALSGSDDQLNTWARRKQYDSRRRVHTTGGDVVTRSQSFQEIKVASTGRGRPISAGNNDRSLSQMSNNSSVRMRRTLPKVPVGAEADIEERKKRMSAEIIRRARAGMDGDVTFSDLVMKDVNNPDSRASEQSSTTQSVSFDDNKLVLPVIQCEPKTSQANPGQYDREPQVIANKSFSCEIVVPQPKYSENTRPPYHDQSELSNGFGPSESRGPDLSDAEDPPRDLHQDLERRVRVRQISQGESSQEALQRIINDLRSAAPNPFEGSSSSRAGSQGSRSSGSSITRELSLDAEFVHQEESENNYGQLAQWGVLQPGEADLGSGSYEQYNRPDSGAEQDEVDGEVHPARHYSQSSGAYSNTNESESTSSDQSDLRVSHPSLHRVLMSCDMIRVSLTRTADFADCGVEVFESTYQDHVDDEPPAGSKERLVNKRVFRTPSGRRPVLGRRKGAFIPVTPGGGGGPEAGHTLSLTAVDRLVTGSPAHLSRELHDGDFIIEVNGVVVINEDVERVRDDLSHGSSDRLHLVVARPRAIGSSTAQTQQKQYDNLVAEDVRKDLERLKFKYDALRQDAERSQDLIADLKIDLKDRDHQMALCEGELHLKDEQLDEFQQRVSRNEEEISEWKYEANHRNVELARLKFETKQKDDRIAQLRRLLIQQTELMQLHHLTNGSHELDDFEEHVSAV